MERVDCDECKHGYYEEDKLRCDLYGISGCKPLYDPEYQCSDCKRFKNCENTQGDSCEPCLEFELDS